MATAIERLITRMVDTFAGQINQTPKRNATLIIGASEGPRLLAASLTRMGSPVMIVERDPELCRVASHLLLVEVVWADPTDVDVIKRVFPGGVANVVVATLDDELNLATCGTVEMNLNPDRLITVVHDKANAIEFEVLGYEVMSIARAAVTLLDKSMPISELRELLRAANDDEMLTQIAVSSPALIGRRLSSLSFSDVDVVDLTRNGQSIAINEFTSLEIGDLITVFGRSRAVEATASEFNPQC